ncbi:MAG: beta-glucosidase, partial [Odoribacter sp.]|nr:beta-glucosidase [Odoribacter sp.]
MFRIYYSLFLFLTITAVGKDKTPYLNSKLPVEIRSQDLIERMTLKEKIGQLSQYVSPDHARNSNPNSEKKDYMQEIDAISVDAPNLDEVSKKIIKGEVGSFLHVFSWQEANYLQALAQESRLKIPLLMGIDAVHGNGMHTGNTIYPTSISMASTFNPNLMEIIGEQTAKEMRAAGMHWTFNPNVEITRDARWGRTGETFGEDPVLVGRMGASLIRGLQGQDNLLSDRVIACAKHMIGGGEPAGGLNGAPMDMSERKLRELYLPSFEAAVKSNVFTVIPAHNELNGIPCHANSYLLKTILREELGFTGFVISDWMDIERLHSMHTFSASEEETFVDAVKAGVDMHMHGPRFLEAIIKAVEE